nr:hypothetical protein [Candidatus Sigynarchaeum springense]
MIYDLVGEGKVCGEFQGSEFVISSDMDGFVAALDSAFGDWDKRTTNREGKI